MAHIVEGKSYSEVASYLHVGKETVKGWIRRFKDNGLEGLRESPRSGAKRKLDAKRENEFKQAVIKSQEERKGGRISGSDIHTLLRDQFDVKCELSTVYNYLQQVNLSWITVRSKHPKQDPKAQETFKKTLTNSPLINSRPHRT